MEVDAYLKTIPNEIIREYIIPYTYKIQDKSLMEDIVNYIEIKQHIKQAYEKYWGHFESNYYHWLTNDIERYINEDISTTFGYTEKCKSIWRRLFYFQDKSDLYLSCYLSTLNNKRGSSAGINIKLGILTPNERQELLENLYIMNIK